MPMTLTLTEGVLAKEDEQIAAKRIVDAMLKWHGLSGNGKMTPNVTTMINVLPKEATLSGGEPFSGVWIEWKTPQFAFNGREIQQGFFKEATDIIEQLAAGSVSRDRIFSNVVHTVDGTWNMDGKAMSNEEIGQAIASA